MDRPLAWARVEEGGAVALGSNMAHKCIYVCTLILCCKGSSRRTNTLLDDEVLKQFIMKEQDRQSCFRTTKMQ